MSSKRGNFSTGSVFDCNDTVVGASSHNAAIGTNRGSAATWKQPFFAVADVVQVIPLESAQVALPIRGFETFEQFQCAPCIIALDDLLDQINAERIRRLTLLVGIVFGAPPLVDDAGDAADSNRED